MSKLSRCLEFPERPCPVLSLLELDNALGTCAELRRLSEVADQEGLSVAIAGCDYDETKCGLVNYAAAIALKQQFSTYNQ